MYEALFNERVELINSTQLFELTDRTFEIDENLKTNQIRLYEVAENIEMDGKLLKALEVETIRIE